MHKLKYLDIVDQHKMAHSISTQKGFNWISCSQSQTILTTTTSDGCKRVCRRSCNIPFISKYD